MTSFDDGALDALCAARAYGAGYAPGAAWAGCGSSVEWATVIDSEPAAAPSAEVELLLAQATLARLERLGRQR